jgi:hypothetical protein
MAIEHRGVPHHGRAALLLSVLLLACSTTTATRPDAQALKDAADRGARLEPASSAEKAVLGQLDSLPPGQSRSFGATTATAGREYDAASGRRCRSVRFDDNKDGAPKTRLACRDDAVWFFVPEVFVARSGP